MSALVQIEIECRDPGYGAWTGEVAALHVDTLDLWLLPCRLPLLRVEDQVEFIRIDRKRWPVQPPRRPADSRAWAAWCMTRSDTAALLVWLHRRQLCRAVAADDAPVERWRDPAPLPEIEVRRMLSLAAMQATA